MNKKKHFFIPFCKFLLSPPLHEQPSRWCIWYKYVSFFGQIYFGNFNKYILEFGQIQFPLPSHIDPHEPLHEQPSRWCMSTTNYAREDAANVARSTLLSYKYGRAALTLWHIWHFCSFKYGISSVIVWKALDDSRACMSCVLCQDTDSRKAHH